MHLLYITFGPALKNHLQAYFSIYSFLNSNANIASIHVITDAPEFYTSIANHLNIIQVDTATLDEWKGPHHFFWRIKIKGIEAICEKYPGEPVLYLDSDTFLSVGSKKNSPGTGTEDFPPGTWAKDFSPLQAYMHENEGPVNKLQTKTMRQMSRQLKGLEIAGLHGLENYCMWNAGVVLTPNNKGLEEIKLALELCDEMCRHRVKDQFVEQFALSVALQHVYGLHPAKKYIAHYWSNKEEWNKAIADHLAKAVMMGCKNDEWLQYFATIDFSGIPINRTIRNTRKRLNKHIERLFPDTNIEF